MARRERDIERYQMSKMLGVCVRCHRPVPNGNVICPECSAVMGACRRARRERRKRDGVCVRCSRPAVPGRTLCLDCSVREAERQKERRRRRVAERLCLTCGRALSSDYRLKTCPICLEKGRRYQLTKALREYEADD